MNYKEKKIVVCTSKDLAYETYFVLFTLIYNPSVGTNEVSHLPRINAPRVPHQYMLYYQRATRSIIYDHNASFAAHLISRMRHSPTSQKS